MNKQVLTNEMVIEKYYELNSVTAVAKHFQKRLKTIRGILRDSGIDTINYSKSKINPITNEKICTKCLTPKSLDSFRLNKKGKYSSSCISCLNKARIILSKAQYHRDPEYRKKNTIRSMEYQKTVPDKTKVWRKKWSDNNRDKINEFGRKYYQERLEYFKDKSKKYHRKRWDSDSEHRERVNNSSKERFQKLYYNDEECKKKTVDKAVNYHRDRYKTDELYKFKTDIRKVVYSAFKRKGHDKDFKSRQILGEEWSVIKDYIESQFSEGMTWDNHGEWVFDHKIPISICKTVEETIILNHYTNFQPLWVKDNLHKSDKILPEFEHLIDEYLGGVRKHDTPLSISPQFLK
jgi:hypothetical protein